MTKLPISIFAEKLHYFELTKETISLLTPLQVRIFSTVPATIQYEKNKTPLTMCMRDTGDMNTRSCLSFLIRDQEYTFATITLLSFEQALSEAYPLPARKKNKNRHIVISDFLGTNLPEDFYDNLACLIFLGEYPPLGMLYECRKRGIEFLPLFKRRLTAKLLNQIKEYLGVTKHVRFKGKLSPKLSACHECLDYQHVGSFQVQYPTISTERDILLCLPDEPMTVHDLMNLPYWNDVAYLVLPQLMPEDFGMVGIYLDLDFEQVVSWTCQQFGLRCVSLR